MNSVNSVNDAADLVLQKIAVQRIELSRRQKMAERQRQRLQAVLDLQRRYRGWRLRKTLVILLAAHAIRYFSRRHLAKVLDQWLAALAAAIR